MTRALALAVKKIRALPPERQDEAAAMLLSLAEQDGAAPALTPEQVEDVRAAIREADAGAFATEAEVAALFPEIRRVIVRYTARALRQIDAIGAYWAERDPAAARNAVRRIHDAIDLLRDTPFFGPPSRPPGTRKLVVRGTPYLVIYRLGRGAVEILRVFHGARNLPR